MDPLGVNGLQIKNLPWSWGRDGLFPQALKIASNTVSIPDRPKKRVCVLIFRYISEIVYTLREEQAFSSDLRVCKGFRQVLPVGGGSCVSPTSFLFQAEMAAWNLQEALPKFQGLMPERI